MQNVDLGLSATGARGIGCVSGPLSRPRKRSTCAESLSVGCREGQFGGKRKKQYVGAGQHGREQAKVGRQRLGENRLDGKEEMNPCRNSRET